MSESRILAVARARSAERDLRRGRVRAGDGAARPDRGARRPAATVAARTRSSDGRARRFIRSVQVGITVVGIASVRSASRSSPRYFDFLAARRRRRDLVRRPHLPQRRRSASSSRRRSRCSRRSVLAVALAVPIDVLSLVFSPWCGCSSTPRTACCACSGSIRAPAGMIAFTRERHPPLGRRRGGRRRDRDRRGGDALQGLRLR